jgi:protein-L-isoaspartate(D-aspartate) O-methyltransferase
MVTAAPSSVPPELLNQLAVNGRMVIPVGTRDGLQQLKIFTRTTDGFEESVQEKVRFVPMLDGAVAK